MRLNRNHETPYTKNLTTVSMLSIHLFRQLVSRIMEQTYA
jgi:hypothetical protein